MIRTAIYGRAALAVLRRMFSRWGDLLRVALFTALALVGVMWASQVGLGKSFIWPDAGWQAMGLVAVQVLGMWAGGDTAMPENGAVPRDMCWRGSLHR